MLACVKLSMVSFVLRVPGANCSKILDDDVVRMKREITHPITHE
jgi:hypothetical protein